MPHEWLPTGSKGLEISDTVMVLDGFGTIRNGQMGIIYELRTPTELWLLVKEDEFWAEEKS